MHLSRQTLFFSALALFGLGLGVTARPASAQVGWATFANGGQVWRSSVGGTPKSLYSGSVAHAVWSASAKYIYFIKTNGEIWRMNNDGSGAKKITTGTHTIYNPIAAYRASDESLIYAKGTTIYKINGSTGAKVALHSGSKTWVGELAIDTTGTKAAGRDSKSDTCKISVGGSETFYDDGCSASISPNGLYLTANVTGHTTLKIYNWNGSLRKTLNVPSGHQWDNQKFAVNSNDWVVYRFDSKSAIGLVRVSDNKNTTICNKASDYPDFFLGTLPPVSGGCAPSDCDDDNPCTDDACVGNSCQNTPRADCCQNASECGDNDACTDDRCVANQCENVSISGCCTSHSQCDDGNACTEDQCVGNKCAFTAIAQCCASDADCKDTNPCTIDSCDIASGDCSNEKAPTCCVVDTECDDGDPCTVDECNSVMNRCENTGSCDADAGSPDALVADASSGDGGTGHHDSSVMDQGEAKSDLPSPAGEAGATPLMNSRLAGGCNVGHGASPFLLIALFLLCAIRYRRR